VDSCVVCTPATSAFSFAVIAGHWKDTCRSGALFTGATMLAQLLSDFCWSSSGPAHGLHLKRLVHARVGPALT